jgi:hypothetical protein
MLGNVLKIKNSYIKNIDLSISNSIKIYDNFKYL